MNLEHNSLKSPIFLLGSHKSGTSLLRSLFDSHPELFVAPIEMHFFKQIGYWVNYNLHQSWPKELKITEKCQSLIDNVATRNNNRNPYSDSVIPDAFDLDLFKYHLEHRQPKNNTELFISYINALHYSLHGKPISDKIRIVEKSVENAEYALLMHQMFPDSKFIHIIRNPYSTLVALRKSKIKSRYPYLGAMVQSLQTSYYNLHRNRPLIKDYLVIKYEDLLLSTDSMMQQLSDFLDIKFADSLMQPTLLGQSWSGNSSSNQSFEDISLSPLHQWKDDITDLEIHFVNQMLLPAVQEFGYIALPTSRSLLAPVPQERLLNYAKNRSFLHLMNPPTLDSI